MQNSTKPRSAKGLPALLLADSFDTYFRPLSFEIPRTLFPVCNLPLLDYTLEFLVSNGITEIYIVCVAHPDKIADHIKSSKWLKVPGLTIKTRVFPKASSEGDALREMCKLMLLREDFILISGDVIANLDLQPAIEAHQERRKKNKECMMTAVLREAPPGHHARASRDDIMAAIDQTTQQIIGYETKCNTSFLQVNKKLGTHPVVFRNDLLDCRIAVCSSGVLQSFEDNFDYTLISQFICGVVNEEILGAQVHAYVAKDKYAARVNCLRTYKAITQDVINRWTFPLVPDNNITNTTDFRVGKYRIYKDKSVSLSRSCYVGQQTVLGAGTQVNANSKIERSTIGPKCRIGKNATIKGSIIWNSVIIGDGVTIIDSVIGTQVELKSNVTIQRGSIIAHNVRVGEGITLPPFTRLTTCSAGLTEKDLGAGGVGGEYVLKKRPEIGTEYVPQDWEFEVEEVDEDSDDSDGEVHENSRTTISMSVINCCVDGLAGEGSVVNSKTELMATKLAFDVDFLELAEGIVITLLSFSPFDSYTFKQNCRVWSTLLKKFIKDSDNNSPAKELIFKLQEYSDDHLQAMKIFPDVLKGLWEATVIDKQAILEWSEEIEEDSDDPACKALLEQCSSLLSALNESSSGSITESDDEWWGTGKKDNESKEDEDDEAKSDGSNKSGEDNDSFSFDSDSF